MRIKFISPRMSLRPVDSEYKRIMAPSLAFLILATLTPAEHEVIIEDGNTGPIHFDDKPDLVGITVNVDTAKSAYEIASAYRRRGIPVIAGGIHVSANPDEARNYFDSICIGEAEEIWSWMLRDAAARRLKPSYFNDRPTAPASIPRPKWEILDPSKYLYTNILFTSRSCPFQCDFCYNSCGYVHHIHRTRPVAVVLDEIRRLRTRHVMFIDDNFIGNPAWTREFLRAIRPLGLQWNAAVSANIANHLGLLDEMRATGCRSLFIGFESINAESLHSARKKQNHREDYETLIREIHSRGIMINASLVFGFDHDRPDVFPNTLDWLVRNKVETMTAHILTPYPGTALFHKLDTEGRILDYDWDHYNTSRVVFAPRHMTPAELSEGYLWIYREFYSFKNIAKRMPDRLDRWLPYLLFTLGYRKFGNVTSLVSKLGLTSSLGRLARRLAYGIG